MSVTVHLTGGEGPGVGDEFFLPAAATFPCGGCFSFSALYLDALFAQVLGLKLQCDGLDSWLATSAPVLHVAPRGALGQRSPIALTAFIQSLDSESQDSA